MVWLYQNNIKLSLDVVSRKIEDHKQSHKEFLKLLNNRKDILITSGTTSKQDSTTEMQRFLPVDAVKNIIRQDSYWLFLVNLITSVCIKIN